MQIEEYLSNWSGDQRIAYDLFSPTVKAEISQCFDEACRKLPSPRNNHDNRRLIALRLVERSKRAEPTETTLKAAVLLALAELKGRAGTDY